MLFNNSCRVFTQQPAPFKTHTRMPAGKFKPSSEELYKDPQLLTIPSCGGFGRYLSLGEGGSTCHGLHGGKFRTGTATTRGPGGWEGGYRGHPGPTASRSESLSHSGGATRGHFPRLWKPPVFIWRRPLRPSMQNCWCWYTVMFHHNKPESSWQPYFRSCAPTSRRWMGW